MIEPDDDFFTRSYVVLQHAHGVGRPEHVSLEDLYQQFRERMERERGEIAGNGWCPELTAEREAAGQRVRDFVVAHALNTTPVADHESPNMSRKTCVAATCVAADTSIR